MPHSHLQSDDSNARADHLTPRQSALPPLSNDSNAPADHLTSRQSALPPLSDDSNAPADQPHTSAEHPHTFKVMIPMPQRISAEHPRTSRVVIQKAPADPPHTSRVMIPMPQRITSHLGRAHSHLQSALAPLSDDSNAPADQTHTFRVTQRIPLTFLGRAPSYL